MNTQDNSEERKVFEAWAHESAIRTDLGSWEGWQATTQRQQERIAELEAQVQALTTRLAAAKETAMTACYVVGYEIAAMGNVHEPSGQVVNRCAAAIDAAIAAGKGEG